MNPVEQVAAWTIGAAGLLTALGVIGKAARTGWRRIIGTRRKPGWARRFVRTVDVIAAIPSRLDALEQGSTRKETVLTGLDAKLQAHIDGNADAAAEYQQVFKPLLINIARDLGVVVTEVRNNGGGSLKDSAHRIERALGLPDPTKHPPTAPLPTV